MVHCALLVTSAHHRQSTRGREKAGSRTHRGLAQARHLHSREKRSGFPSGEQHISPHLVTREPSLSWTARTSRHGAFQEVASSDLGGRRPKGGNPLASRRQCNRSTPGPLLPPEEKPRSQSSGCQPATARLKGRRSHARKLVYIGLRAGFIRYIWKVSCHLTHGLADS
jgi:hypothetical protein